MTRVELIEKLRGLLFRRRYAYQQTFRGPFGEEVLKDLAVYCFASMTTFQGDRDGALLAEGRRQVWLRMAEHLNMSPEELWKKYDGRAAE